MTEHRLSSSYYRSGSASPTKGSTFNLYREDAESDHCKRCSKYIYPLELMGPVMGYKYHKLCFRCHICDRQLDFINYRTNLIDLNDRQLYCVNHHPRNGKYTDSLFAYRLSSKSPQIESHEYSEYYHESKSQEKYSYGNINFEENPNHKDHLGKSYDFLHNNTHELGFFGRERFDTEERQRLEREKELELERQRDLTRRAELERERELELERQRERDRQEREIEIERQYELQRLEQERLRELELQKELLRLKEIERQRDLDRQKEMEREQLLEEERLKHNLEQIRHENLEENSVEEHLVNILNKIRNDNTNTASSSLNTATQSSSSIIINSATKDFYNSKDIPVNLNDSFHETHEIKIIPSSNLSNLGNIIQEAKRHEENNATQYIPVHHYESKDEHLKDVFQEARLADMSRSETSVSNENLRDIFYEAALATMNRSDWSFVSNQDDSLEINDPDVDHNLKDIFYEANKASGSRATSTALHSNSKDNLNWSHAIQNYNSYSETVVHKQNFHSTVIASSTNFNSEPSSLKNLMADAIQTDKNKFAYDKPIFEATSKTEYAVADPENLTNVKKVIKDVQKMEGYTPPDINLPDPENMTNVKEIVSDIQKMEGYSRPSSPFTSNAATPDPQTMSNLKKMVSEMIHTDVSSPITVESRPNVRPGSDLSMTRQNSDGRTLDEIRPEIIGENKGYGVVRLTVQYDEIRDRLSITVHEARGLKNIDPKGMIDPYARVYLHPDEKQKLKRKTKLVKNSINPKWQETFDYSMTQQEALTRTLVVNLKDERGFFEKPENKFLGEVVMKLKFVPHFNYPFTRWFYLQPLNSCANILAALGN
ncbi:bifunctional alpha-2-3 -2-8-sialyltransferase [Brachionus plicatilis]|uniref:Bifunctional alpha-2-3-2-8-sialyltransferase n=1 Tax=Brachionus plicatilis TaxID=10195 RepID=A0A3M7P937_BRAPC|nr:bifunctional alpha-2-3 -2-8-sialyltransferase [Brachionus plicatilis]